MRDIKFRAWDGERLYTKVLIGNVSDPNSEDYTAHCIYRDGDWFHSDEHDSIVFEQYTGIRDKNGVDIFEGDVLRASIDSYIGVVVYLDRTARFLVNTYKNGKMTDYSIGVLDFINKRSKAMLSECVVVGNIHQNQELIND